LRLASSMVLAKAGTGARKKAPMVPPTKAERERVGGVVTGLFPDSALAVEAATARMATDEIFMVSLELDVG